MLHSIFVLFHSFFTLGNCILKRVRGNCVLVKTKAVFMKVNPAFVCYSLDFNDSYS